MRVLILIVAALAVSAPAWGQTTQEGPITRAGPMGQTTPGDLMICPDGHVVAIPHQNVLWGDYCGQRLPPAMSPDNQNCLIGCPPPNVLGVPQVAPDELKAAAESIAPKVAHGLLSVDVVSCELEGRCNVFVGLRAGDGAPAKPNGDLLVSEDTIVGACAGVTPFTGNRNIAIGDHTRFPPNASGFVNIGNKLCFWRDTGERAACPAPEPECGKGK